MAVEGKTILQTMERTELTGKEGIPFQEGTQNGHVLVEKIKEYIGSDIYILPGTPGVEEGWSTTDVESIVGNYDDFYEAVKSGKIITAYIDSNIMCSTERTYINTDNTVLLIFSLSAGHIVYEIKPNNMRILYTTKIPVGISDDVTSNDSTIAASTKLTTQLNKKIAEISNPASAEKDGLMSKEDKAKVDGIQFNTDENSVWFNGKKYGVILLKEDFLQLTASSSSTDIQAALGTFTSEYWKAAYDMGMTAVVQDTYSSYLGFIRYSIYGNIEYLDISLIDDSFKQLKIISVKKDDSGYSVANNAENESILSTDVTNDLTTDLEEYPLSAAMGKKLQDEKLAKSDVVNNLTTADASKALSAAQGKALNDKIEGLTTKTEATTESTKELQANTYYVFGEVETLTLTLAAGEDNVMPEYMFEFTSGATPTVITPIEGVEWRGDAIEANKVYQASIVRGIGILVGRDIA